VVLSCLLEVKSEAWTAVVLVIENSISSVV
jgi:hypothetical protein